MSSNCCLLLGHGLLRENTNLPGKQNYSPTFDKTLHTQGHKQRRAFLRYRQRRINNVARHRQPPKLTWKTHQFGVQAAFVREGRRHRDAERKFNSFPPKTAKKKIRREELLNRRLDDGNHKSKNDSRDLAFKNNPISSPSKQSVSFCSRFLGSLSVPLYRLHPICRWHDILQTVTCSFPSANFSLSLLLVQVN